MKDIARLKAQVRRERFRQKNSPTVSFNTSVPRRHSARLEPSQVPAVHPTLCLPESSLLGRVSQPTQVVTHPALLSDWRKWIRSDSDPALRLSLIFRRIMPIPRSLLTIQRPATD